MKTYPNYLQCCHTQTEASKLERKQASTWWEHQSDARSIWQSSIAKRQGREEKREIKLHQIHINTSLGTDEKILTHGARGMAQWAKILSAEHNGLVLSPESTPRMTSIHAYTNECKKESFYSAQMILVNRWETILVSPETKRSYSRD